MLFNCLLLGDMFHCKQSVCNTFFILGIQNLEVYVLRTAERDILTTVTTAVVLSGMKTVPDK